MAIDSSSAKALMKAIRTVTGNATQQPERSLATCVRVDKDGTRWVRMLGSDTDTPVNGMSYFDSAPNDLVEVEVSDGVMRIVGNASSPAVGSGYVSDAVTKSQESTVERIGALSDTVADDLLRITKNIIDIINRAASGGTIDVSKLNLTNYLTSTQVTGAISSAISSAFNMSSATSQIVQAFATAFNYSDPDSYAGLFLTYLDAYVISPVVTTLNNNIARAVASIDVGGANLLDNTQWKAAGDLKTVASLTEGAWYKEGYATVAYSSGMLVISTSRTSGYYGCTQRVALEPSTNYIISAEVGSTYQIGIGTNAYTTDSGGWVTDGKRVWKTYETEADQTYAFVYMYALGGSTPTPCVVNRVMFEKATTPSDWSPSAEDVSDGISEAYDLAEQTADALAARKVVVGGTVGQSKSVPANGYYDHEDVSFGVTFASAPVVTLTIYTTSTATTFDCDIYLRSVSTTGFTARVVNREGTPRSPGFHWQAVGTLAG